MQAGTMGLAVFLLFVMSVDGKQWRFRPKKGLCLCVYCHQPTSWLVFGKNSLLWHNAHQFCFWKSVGNNPLTFTHAKCAFVKEIFFSRDLLFTTFVRSQVQKMESLHWEDLQQNTAREVCLGYRHGRWGLWVLEFIWYCWWIVYKRCLSRLNHILLVIWSVKDRWI